MSLRIASTLTGTRLWIAPSTTFVEAAIATAVRSRSRSAVRGTSLSGQRCRGAFCSTPVALPASPIVTCASTVAICAVCCRCSTSGTTTSMKKAPPATDTSGQMFPRSLISCGLAQSHHVVTEHAENHFLDNAVRSAGCSLQTLETKFKIGQVVRIARNEAEMVVNGFGIQDFNSLGQESFQERNRFT